MIRRLKSGFLWGVVGALTVLAAAQGYVLLVGDLPLGFGGVLLLAAVVGAAVAAATYATEHRLTRKGRT